MQKFSWNYKDFVICVDDRSKGTYIVWTIEHHKSLYLDIYGKIIDIATTTTDLYKLRIDFNSLEEIEKALSIYYDFPATLDIPRTTKTII